MQHRRAVQLLNVTQIVKQLVDIVTVYRPDVADAHRVKRVARGRIEKPPGRLFAATAEVYERVPDTSKVFLLVSSALCSQGLT